jgi:acetate kinase
VTAYAILVLNCGSSSIKFAILNPVSGQKISHGIAEKLGTNDARLSIDCENKIQSHVIDGNDYAAALEALLAFYQHNHPELLQTLTAVGHRVVHGGTQFRQSTRLDKSVIQGITECIPLAPLHNPANLQGIHAAQTCFPHLPQCAVFDTAFHHTLPEKAFSYALPQPLCQTYGIRRYGFHGISHQYVCQQAAQHIQKPWQTTHFISAHLGNGCSATAVSLGKSVDTSMGLTPLEGLVMGTRCGDVDPGIYPFLNQHLNYSIERINNLLNKESGLLGLSQNSMDMRIIEESYHKGDPFAQLAVDVFCHKLAKTIAGLATNLPHIDALIFTGGIGENSSLVRAKTLAALAILGFDCHQQNNMQHGRSSNQCISKKNTTKALVIATNEELMIAQESFRLLEDIKNEP